MRNFPGIAAGMFWMFIGLSQSAGREADVSVKPGVHLGGLSDEILAVIDSVAETWGVCAPGRSVVITSGRREPGRRFSFHQQGDALDFRMRNLTQDEIHCVEATLPSVLPQTRRGRYDWTTHPEYPVGDPMRHLHIEVDTDERHSFESER